MTPMTEVHIYNVFPTRDGRWKVMEHNVELARLDSKFQAELKAIELGRQHRPSQVAVHKTNGHYERGYSYR